MSLLTLPEDLFSCICKYNGVTFKLLLTCTTTKKKVQKYLWHLYLNAKFRKEDIKQYILQKMYEVIRDKEVNRTINFVHVFRCENKTTCSTLTTVSFMYNVRTEIEDHTYTPVICNRHYFSNFDKKIIETDALTCVSFSVKYPNIKDNSHISSMKIREKGNISIKDAKTLAEQIVYPSSKENITIIPDVNVFSDMLTSRGSFKLRDDERLEIVKRHYETTFREECKDFPSIFEPPIIEKTELIDVPPPRILDPLFPLFE